MSQILKLELSDDIYDIIRRQAKSAGTSPEEWLVHSLKQKYNSANTSQNEISPINEAEQLIARERFERHFGEVDLGYPTGVDNESIDADLAREYANNHLDR